MKLVKSLLLAAPATLIAVVAAQAADLPAYKSAPVEYVRVCDAYGSGFFYIPGTDTCLEVGGYVRFQPVYSPGHNYINPLAAGNPVTQIGGAQDTTGMQVRGRLDLDARTQTQWGTVQSVVHLRSTVSDGIRTVGGSTNFQTASTPVTSNSAGLTLERAYIRFAGFTAGVSSENFSTMPAYMYGPTLYAGFPNGVKQLAYTATFGGGFSATIAAESKNDMNNNNVSGATNLQGLPTAYDSEYVNQFDTGYVLVGNARYDANWGYVQVNGAVTDNSINGTTLTSAYLPLDGPKRLGAWAAGFSFRYNLPFISPGDQFHFQFAYSQGIVGELFSSGSLNDAGGDATNERILGGVINVPTNIIATSATGATVDSVGQTSGFSAFGMYTHYWTPTWNTNVDVGYLKLYEPNAALSAGLQNGNSGVLAAGANLIWAPTKNFNIGVELDYVSLRSSLQNAVAGDAGAGWLAAGKPGLNVQGFDGILRIERQF